MMIIAKIETFPLQIPFKPGTRAAASAWVGEGLMVADSPDAMVEWRYFDLEAQIYGGALAPVDGRIAVPERPGLGIDPDPHVIRDYLRIGTDTHTQKAAA